MAESTPTRVQERQDEEAMCRLQICECSYKIKSYLLPTFEEIFDSISDFLNVRRPSWPGFTHNYDDDYGSYYDGK